MRFSCECECYTLWLVAHGILLHVRVFAWTRRSRASLETCQEIEAEYGFAPVFRSRERVAVHFC